MSYSIARDTFYIFSHCRRDKGHCGQHPLDPYEKEPLQLAMVVRLAA
jgi:hypothetical protein